MKIARVIIAILKNYGFSYQAIADFKGCTRQRIEQLHKGRKHKKTKPRIKICEICFNRYSRKRVGVLDLCYECIKEIEEMYHDEAK